MARDAVDWRELRGVQQGRNDVGGSELGAARFGMPFWLRPTTALQLNVDPFPTGLAHLRSGALEARHWCSRRAGTQHSQKGQLGSAIR